MSPCLHNVTKPSKPKVYTKGARSLYDGRMQFRLGHYRRKAGLTQRQVADALGISNGLYNQLESGKRRMNETYLEDLAKLYRISPTQLIVDPTRDDPLYAELDAAFRLLSPSEREIVVNSIKGIAAGRAKP